MLTASLKFDENLLIPNIFEESSYKIVVPKQTSNSIIRYTSDPSLTTCEPNWLELVDKSPNER